MATMELMGIATLDDLIQMEGVCLAFEFGVDGKLKDYKARADISREMVESASQFCATVTMMFNTLAGAYTKMSGWNWTPQKGWAYVSEEWAVCIGGDGYRAVWVETSRADFNKIYQAVVGGR